MSTSNHTKVLKQIRNKPAKYEKFLKHNVPRKRKFGRSTKACRRCGRTAGHISKYGLHFCRQCFRQIATKIGFKKYS
ncbi:MAG: 30S ribosomal protein S14 [Nanoarchaeota archaeon]|nr:30S ribosomal protein S14 [Nanoarchaeota archaeon]MBU1321364.1 30S ribosomal protein S14 [Nanoarchaeota archaeon]MBU1597356.1 30S ribosomal protein S14 [Nanoarchaeota archaeon]MBU2441271.1 30S ribosomal protein S14 [Nanoarchaeota archaeon]